MIPVTPDEDKQDVGWMYFKVPFNTAIAITSCGEEVL
jgi:hypothetical protein